MIGGIPLSMFGPKCAACGFHHESDERCKRLITDEDMAKFREMWACGEFPDKGATA